MPNLITASEREQYILLIGINSRYVKFVVWLVPYKLGGEIWQSECCEHVIHCIGMTEAFEKRQYYFKVSSQNYKHLFDFKYLLTFAFQTSKQKMETKYECVDVTGGCSRLLVGTPLQSYLRKRSCEVKLMSWHRNYFSQNSFVEQCGKQLCFLLFGLKPATTVPEDKIIVSKLLLTEPLFCDH